MILDQILAETRRTVERAKLEAPRARLEIAVASAPPARGLAAALQAVRAAHGGAVACIAEVKRRSPSAGWIRQNADAAAIAAGYAAAGAAAVSVLTDGPFFGGTLDDLRRVRTTTSIPVLRKDFVVDPYQIVEARAAGADAVLLIVAALDDGALAALLAETARHGMDALVETHDEREIERAIAAGARLVGINHRDLRTFEMDMTLAVRMRARIPPACAVVAESGIRTPADVELLRQGGVDAILVGETLMRASDPGAALRALLT